MRIYPPQDLPTPLLIVLAFCCSMLAVGILLLGWLIYDRTIGYKVRREERIADTRLRIMERAARLKQEKEARELKAFNLEIKAMVAWQSELDDSYIRAMHGEDTDEL